HCSTGTVWAAAAVPIPRTTAPASAARRRIALFRSPSIQLSPYGHPHRHFRRAAVAPGIIGDQAQVDSPRRCWLPFAIKGARPFRFRAGLGLALQDGDAAEQTGVETRR